MSSPQQSETVEKVIGYLLGQDWYSVAGLIDHMRLAFPEEYARAVALRRDQEQTSAMLVRGIEYWKAEAERVKEFVGG
jgi:hypothetical protein